MGRGDRPGGYTLAPGAEWTDRAATWPAVVVSRETEPGHWLTSLEQGARPDRAAAGKVAQLHLCCARCESRPSVLCLSPDAADEPYVVTVADMLAGMLAHIRASHPDVVAS